MVGGVQRRPDEFIDAGEIVVVIGRYRGVARRDGSPSRRATSHVWTAGAARRCAASSWTRRVERLARDGAGSHLPLTGTSPRTRISAMSVALVVAESEAVGMREAGDSAVVLEMIGAADGLEALTQRVIHFTPGQALPRGDTEHDDLLYVVAGSGRWRCSPRRIRSLLARQSTSGRATRTLSKIRARTTSSSSRCSSHRARGGRPDPLRKPVVRLEERPEQRADAKRTYLVLFGADTGCPTATQFVGFWSSRTGKPDSHPYDEVGYVLAGTGLAHMGGEPVPIGPARASISARARALHREHRPGDEDPRRLPPRRARRLAHTMLQPTPQLRRFCPVETSINALKEGTE